MNERFNMIVLLNTNDGGTNKFEEIYHTYSHYLYTIGLRILKDSDLASDALQQCYFKIYQNIDRIKDIKTKQTRSFLGIIMRNESLEEELFIIDESADIEETLAKAAEDDMLDEFDRWEKDAADVKVPVNTEFNILSMADEFHKIQIREERKSFLKRLIRIVAVVVLAAATTLTVLTVSVEAVRVKIFELL